MLNAPNEFFGKIRNQCLFGIHASEALGGVPKLALAVTSIPCSLVSPDICPFLTDYIRPKPDICLENAYMWITCNCQSKFWDALFLLIDGALSISKLSFGVAMMSVCCHLLCIVYSADRTQEELVISDVE